MSSDLISVGLDVGRHTSRWAGRRGKGGEGRRMRQAGFGRGLHGDGRKARGWLAQAWGGGAALGGPPGAQASGAGRTAASARGDAETDEDHWLGWLAAVLAGNGGGRLNSADSCQ